MTSTEIVMYIFQKFHALLFSVEITTGVKLGWVIITAMLFIIVIRSILNIPSGLSFRPKSDYRGDKNG